MNFIFISPSFPHTYWQFCDRLAQRGVRVLGIGDTPYDELEDELKWALTEYYKVSSLEDYDQVFRAVAFFSFKYGKIDWLESNNEYWLEQDARLRTDFHITTGIQADEIGAWKHKSAMKQVYLSAGIPTARCHRVTTLEAARAFLDEIGGYPVIAKPDVGVGAANTWKLTRDEELRDFFDHLPSVPYLMEEFIEGDICSYDAITDSHAQPLFESMTVWPPSIADIVNQNLDLSYYTDREVPEPLRDLGRRTLTAFQVKSRFVHLEFFRLTSPRKGLGEIGDFVALEVNMRPAGGYTPDMMDFAHACDVYGIWADMVTQDRRVTGGSGEDHWCVYASRKDDKRYVHTHEEVMERYGENMVMQEAMPPMMQPQMGNTMYTARLRTEEDAKAFIRFVQTQK
mgnify:CR=1 FL=1